MNDLPHRLKEALSDRYELERELGEGGMATVYLAQDLKHGRKVALKVLRPELAAVIGAERFLAEIKTTANLQHPHILPLFDSGEADGFLYYVMPFIDGETLRERLDREKQLGVDEAVRIARDVADALDYAHRQGVIHRDIKPSNVLLHDGRPVVADFGIALAISAAGAGRMTETGLSLGTPHYMSPEQASADRDLSARSDVYSLGCVLYEMIAGQPPHTGPSAQSILVRILTDTPRPLTELRHTVPPHVSATVAKSVEKLPADRFESAKAFMDALDDPSFTYTPPAPATAVTTAASAAVPPRDGRPLGIPAWLAGVMGAVLLVGGYAIAGITQSGPAPPPSAQFTIVPDPSHTVVSPCCGRAVAVSAAGDRIVYQGLAETTVRLYQRPLNQRVAQAIPGTEGGRHPFFSPDGEWLGFFSGNSLHKVRFDGGTPLTVLSGLNTNGGAAWALDNTIVFATREDPRLYRVSADGDDPVAVTTVDTAAGEVAHRWPHVLPDGETVVFGVAVAQDEGSTVEMLAATSLQGGGHRVLATGADPRYVDPEFLVYSDAAGSIMAQAFDAQALELTGARFRIAERATWRGSIAALSEYDISRNGTLVYREASTTPGGEQELVVVDVDGNLEVLTRTDPIRHPRFSPDGRYVAYELEGDARQVPDDIWVWDHVRANPIRVTFELDNSFPVWSVDGSRVLFETDQGILDRAADGSGESETLQEVLGNSPPHVPPDGRWLLWTTRGGESYDIWLRPLDGSAEARPLLASAFDEWAPAVSPDGRWIAYVSDDSGEDEIYVEPFPDLGRRFKVTTGGARGPVWAPDGSRLYYRQFNAPAFDLVAIDVRAGDRFDVGERVVLFETGAFRRGAFWTNYGIHPDGTRFVFVRGQATAATGDTHVVITNALNVGSEGR
jgi:serine/threonine-protein kinase